jgi:hypothetical protein
MAWRRPYVSWPVRIGFPLGVLGALCARYAVLLPVLYDNLLARYRLLKPSFDAAGIAGLVDLASRFGQVAAAALLLAAIGGLLLRGRWLLGLIRKSCIAAWMAVWLYGTVVCKATAVIQQRNLMPDGIAPDSFAVFLWRWDMMRPVLLAAAAVAVLYLMAWRGGAIAAWTGAAPSEPAPGDRVLESLRTHGPDPRFRKSLWSSLGAHVFFILILPWILSFWGCVEPYRVPKGSGTPEVAIARVVKAEKKKKKKKRLVVNPMSAISFHVPDLDESPIERQVEEISRVTYQADPSRIAASAGKMGVGGGKTGGWPDGMENSKVRFIRMEYDGPGWDDGMDVVSRADMNFLDAFRKMTGFNVANRSESHPIALLARYPRGFAPPFVYMTGHGDIRVSDKDVRILREYLLGGGMLFADCGSPRWDAAFRSLAQRTMPGEPLRVIADDDIIFQLPFTFPNGAPPLWHHGGTRAMGMKHKGRWVIFYHPGDVNDAWKTGRSGMEARLAEGAIEIGVNIVYYSFTHYLELTRKHRK